MFDFFYSSADGPEADASWSVYRETYDNPDATGEPVEVEKIGTYPSAAVAFTEELRRYRETVR